MSDLKHLDDCFATNSSLKVYPVAKIDDIVISNGCGPIVKTVIDTANDMFKQSRNQR